MVRMVGLEMKGGIIMEPKTLILVFGVLVTSSSPLLFLEYLFFRISQPLVLCH